MKDFSAVLLPHRLCTGYKQQKKNKIIMLTSLINMMLIL